jgi:hypothetical protein
MYRTKTIPVLVPAKPPQLPATTPIVYTSWRSRYFYCMFDLLKILGACLFYMSKFISENKNIAIYILRGIAPYHFPLGFIR